VLLHEVDQRGALGRSRRPHEPPEDSGFEASEGLRTADC
jgi:hypothetical protein